MNQFKFESKTKAVLGGFMLLGLFCMVMTYVGDDGFKSQFWSNYLHNTTFFVGISFVSLFVLAAFTTAYAGWHTVLKRVWEAYSLFLIPGLILMLVLIAGLQMDWHHLYHWADPASVAADPILQSKAPFLNKTWYSLGTIIIVGAWIFFAVRLRNLSKAEDQSGTSDYDHHRKIKLYSAIFLPIAGFTSAAMIWQWVMSIDAHWYSTLYAWYCTASWFVAAMALTIMTLIWMKSKGYYENVSDEHFHDLGKYLFAFSVFWTYLWFSQYMLIWYSNNGEETGYFYTRIHEYPVLYFGNLIINFALPFLILMRNDTKRKFGTLFFVSFIVFIGHWWDYFQMIKPGVEHTAHEIHAMHDAPEDDLSDAAHVDEHAAADSHGDHGDAHGEDHGDAHGSEFKLGMTIPGPLEFGTMLGFLAFFLYFALGRMEKAGITPENDPYLEESKHHHV